MLKQLALILAIVIVAILAIVAALTIINGGPENEETGGDPTESARPRSTITVSVGADGSQVEIACLPPVDDQRPFLVSFENQTDVRDDLQAQVLVRHDDDVVSTVVASAPGLRPGERRSVIPEPWLDPKGFIDCEILAVQASDHVILVEPG